MARKVIKTKTTRKRTQQPIDKTKQRILFAIILLGVFSILSGLGLIVAANWASIPALLKVSAGLVALALSLVGVSYSQKNNHPYWMEAMLFVSFLLIGGNMALIQQSYNLALSWTEGSFIYWILSLPLVCLTKRHLLPICSMGLLVFTLWDYIWDMNYMLLAGFLFVFMMLTHFFEGALSTFLRKLAMIMAIFVLFIGDVYSNSGGGLTGILATALFLLFSAGTPKTEEGLIKYYNYLFIFVAFRIFLLFWSAYYDLTSIGILLMVFGTILLAGVGLYYYYFQQIQQIIKRFVRHEQ